MVEGQRHAELVLGPEAQEAGHLTGVVDDVVVAQRRSLGVAGGAAGELHVDRVMRVEGLPVASESQAW